MNSKLSSMRKLTSFLFLIAVSFPLAGQPKLFLPTGTKIDLGKLPEMVETRYSISIKNVGNDTLRLDHLSTSCGCTVAKLLHNSVPPQDSTSILLLFNNKEINGPSLRHVFLSTNDTLSKKVDIAFAATVIPVLKSDPRYISFGTMKMNEKVRRIVHIENTSEDTVNILSSHCFDKRIRIILNQRVIPPHIVADVIAECDASSTAKLLGEIDFGTSSTLKPLLKISYTGKIVQ